MQQPSAQFSRVCVLSPMRPNLLLNPDAPRRACGPSVVAPVSLVPLGDSMRRHAPLVVLVPLFVSCTTGYAADDQSLADARTPVRLMTYDAQIDEAQGPCRERR